MSREQVYTRAETKLTVKSFNNATVDCYESDTIPNSPSQGVILVYFNRKVFPRFCCLSIEQISNSPQWSCESLRNYVLEICEITPFVAHLFHLIDAATNLLIPLGKEIKDQQVLLLRILWRPEKLKAFHVVDPNALFYLYHQCHDDFVHGDILEKLPESEQKYETLLGWAMYDMIAFALNSDPKIPLSKLKKTYNASQFLSSRVLTEVEPKSTFKSFYRFVNLCRINNSVRKGLEMHYHEYDKTTNSRYNVMHSYIKSITDCTPHYFSIEARLADDKGFLMIDSQNNQILRKFPDGSMVSFVFVDFVRRISKPMYLVFGAILSHHHHHFIAHFHPRLINQSLSRIHHCSYQSMGMLSEGVFSDQMSFLTSTRD